MSGRCVSLLATTAVLVGGCGDEATHREREICFSEAIHSTFSGVTDRGQPLFHLGAAVDVYEECVGEYQAPDPDDPTQF